MYSNEIVVQREQGHEGEEHGDGREEVPDIVRVIEVEEPAKAGLIVIARLRRRCRPRRRVRHEEFYRATPDDYGQEKVDCRLEEDSFLVAELESKS